MHLKRITGAVISPVTVPVPGFLLRRFSSRYVMLGGALLFNIMLCLVGFVDQTWQLVAGLFCFGSARNLFNISANAQSLGVKALYSKSIIANLQNTLEFVREQDIREGRFLQHLRPTA